MYLRNLHKSHEVALIEWNYDLILTSRTNYKCFLIREMEKEREREQKKKINTGRKKSNKLWLDEQLKRKRPTRWNITFCFIDKNGQVKCTITVFVDIVVRVRLMVDMVFFFFSNIFSVTKHNKPKLIESIFGCVEKQNACNRQPYT